ncbi:MAG: GNAT family N-acetyltransferase [Clostridium sp.]|nr:GNAT family N-acetyltransferase [Clostridium sp.]
MEFRKTVANDLSEVMKIIKDAQEYFKEQGIDQWQNNYPNEEVIKSDIENNHSYVLIKDGKVVATTVASFAGEKTYDKIYEGKWLTKDKYIVIHRVAVASTLKGLGVAGELMKNIEKLAFKNNVKSIKGDTHEDNKSMQRMFEKNGFARCGVIYLEDKSKRIAFEKRL